MARKQFHPHTMEVTRELEIAGLEEHEAERLRKELLSEATADDPVLRTALAALEEPAWTQVRWKKWRDWGQYSPGASGTAAAGEGVPRKTQELTTRYQVEPEEGDEPGQTRS